jgi:hypothetical protein
MPEKNRGLSPEQCVELDKFDEVFPNGEKSLALRIAELRQQYAGNTLAQHDLDRFDTGSEWHRNYQIYASALKSGDINKQKELERWFSEYDQNL